MTLQPGDRAALTELAPVLRRVDDLDPSAVVRLRLSGKHATVLARLPFGVLVSRTVEAGLERPELDTTVAARELLAWTDGDRVDQPTERDGDWRGGSPPRTGWARLDTVPDDVIRPLVRSGALALKDAAAREGVPGAQPRAEVADALLDSVVLTVAGAPGTVRVTLRMASALTRMGFLRRGGVAGVDLSGRWLRLAAEYGSVLAERPGATLTLR